MIMVVVVENLEARWRILLMGLKRCQSCKRISSDIHDDSKECDDCHMERANLSAQMRGFKDIHEEDQQWADYKKDMDNNEDRAVKHDEGKPDFTQISWELLEAHGRVREFGAKKYSRNNWKKGFKITRSLAAALRHIFKFLGGEDNDTESGLNHLGHAVCCLEHALYDFIHHPENDDRKT